VIEELEILYRELGIDVASIHRMEQ
jgi:hypothetical protein